MATPTRLTGTLVRQCELYTDRQSYRAGDQVQIHLAIDVFGLLLRASEKYERPEDVYAGLEIHGSKPPRVSR